jgi:hypothetical protein
MLREMAVLSAAMVALQLVAPGARAAQALDARPDMTLTSRIQGKRMALKPHAPRMGRTPAGPGLDAQAGAGAAVVTPVAAMPSMRITHIAHVHRVRRPPVTVSADLAPDSAPELTDQEDVVSQLAEMKGDRDFLMVDKTHGKIILFENNEPVFSGPALTGESTADNLPPNALHEKFDKLNALDTKVTPAGRYTVSRSHDDDYGTVLDINEIHGTDWGIAIHRVYLGTPSEHREQRIESPDEQARHITFGCINVTPDAIAFLLKKLPAKGATPLYILPEDDSKTVAYFTPPTS